MQPPQKPGLLDTILSGASYVPFLGPLAGAIEGQRLHSDLHQYTEQFRKAGQPETSKNLQDVRDWTDKLSLNEQRLLKSADPHLFRAAQVDSMSSAMEKGDYTEMAQHADSLGLPPSAALSTIYSDKGNALFQNFYKDFAKTQDPTQPVSREDALMNASKYAATQKMSPMTRNAFLKTAANSFQSLPSRKDIRTNQLQQDQWASANFDIPLHQKASADANLLMQGKPVDETALQAIISKAPPSIQHQLVQSYYKAREAALTNLRQHAQDQRLKTKDLAPDIAAEYTPGLAAAADQTVANTKAGQPMDYTMIQDAINKVPLASRGAAAKFVWDRITKANAGKDKKVATGLKQTQNENQTEKTIASEAHGLTQNPDIVNASKFAGNIHSALQATKAMLRDPRRQNSKAYESLVSGLVVRALDQQAARQFLVQKFGASQSWIDQMSGLANRMREGGIGLTPDTLKQMGTLLYGLALYQKDMVHQQIDPFLSTIDKASLSPSRKDRLKALAGAPLRTVDSLVNPENTSLFGADSPYLQNNVPVSGSPSPAPAPAAPPQAPASQQPPARQVHPDNIPEGTILRLNNGTMVKKTAEGYVPVQSGAPQ